MDVILAAHCATGDVHTVQALITLGADVCPNHGVALWMAAACGHINVVTILLNNGDNYTRDNVIAAAFIAKTCHQHKISQLLDQHIDLM